ncbi:hypothetical protein HY450_03715 [Candidatus Pacearchaeota archaeon]|nr:hypothetical protein [Candidatus Pacearchaeota archaeon]
MGDWKFLKKPEFLVTTIIALLLTFVGGLFIGKSYVINGDFAELQNEYNLLNSSYNKFIIQNSQGNIVTQNQQGNNLVLSTEKPARHLSQTGKSQIDSALLNYNGNVIEINYEIDYEVKQFASELYQYLNTKGLKIRVTVLEEIYNGSPEITEMFISDDGILTFNIKKQN